VYVVDQLYSDRTSLISYVEVVAAFCGSLFLYVKICKHLTFYFLLSQRIFYFLKRKFVAVTHINCRFVGGNSSKYGYHLESREIQTAGKLRS
jgi:hypothetical protein